MEFKENFFAWSLGMTGKANSSEYEEGDKIILPQNVIMNLKPSEDGSPLFFKLTNQAQERSIHCGVLEFSALVGNCHLPYWMMSQLILTEGEPITIELVKEVPKATSIKLKPQSRDIMARMSDPKAVLEVKLRKFTCATIGTWFCIPYLGENIYFDVVETTPGPVVSLIDTECNLEFDLPPVRRIPAVRATSSSKSDTGEESNTKSLKPLSRFPGKGRRLGHK